MNIALPAFALIGFIFRLQALNFKGYLKFYDYDREIAKKYEIYSLCTESQRYELYHFIGMLLSVVSFVSSLAENSILNVIFICCCFVYALLYGLKFEKYIREAGKNEKKCVYLLKHIVNLNGSKDYEMNTIPEDASAIHFLYLCCNHDKMTLLFDLVPMLLLALSIFV